MEPEFFPQNEETLPPNHSCFYRASHFIALSRISHDNTVIIRCRHMMWGAQNPSSLYTAQPLSISTSQQAMRTQQIRSVQDSTPNLSSLMSVAARFGACTLFACSNIGIVGSNPT
jgi:hypothetical protein